jgi:probable HAF family extracellular repeat protein
MYNVVLLPNSSDVIAITAINASGTVTRNTRERFSPTPQAFDKGDALVWSSPLYGVPQRLQQAALSGVNANSECVGVQFAPEGTTTPRSIMVKQGTVIPLRVDTPSAATGINDQQKIVGNIGTEPVFNLQSYLFDFASAGRQLLNPPPGFASLSARGINKDGVIAFSAVNLENTVYGFRLRGVGWENLGRLGASGSIAGINVASQVVGTVEDNSSGVISAAIWAGDSSEPLLLPMPSGDESFGNAINTAGDVVGSYLSSTSIAHAFLYSGGQTRDLNDLIARDSGWVLNNASAINDNGEIAGIGSFRGAPAGFVLTPASNFSLAGIVARILFGVIDDAAGLLLLPSGLKPVGPRDPIGWNQLSRRKRDALLGLALDQLALSYNDPVAGRAIRQASLESIRRAVDEMIRELGTGKK